MRTLAEKSYRIFFWGIPTEILIIAAFCVRLEGQYSFAAFFKLLFTGGGYRRLPPWLFAFFCGVWLFFKMVSRALQPKVRIEICKDMMFINGSFHKTEGILLSQVMNVTAMSGFKSTGQTFSQYEAPERVNAPFWYNYYQRAIFGITQYAARISAAGSRNLSTRFLRKSGRECGTIILRVNGEELRDIKINGIKDVFGVYEALLAETARYRSALTEEIEEHTDETRRETEEWERKSRYTTFDPFGSAHEDAGDGSDKP